MNIRIDAEGNIYTSESGPGTIKKFDQDGKMLNYVALARIAPGSKHVAIDMSDDLMRVYMLDITRSRIIVFEDRNHIKASELPDTTSPSHEDEK